MKRKNKSLLLLLLILGIGFAAIGTTLYINGNAIISSNSNDFDVKFTKAIRGDENISSTAISSDGKSITYDTENLSEKDAISVLTYTVTNNSSLYDADVSVECSTGTHNDLYSVTNNLDSPVEAKTSKDGTITVKLLQDPEEELSEEFTCTLTATATERTSIAVKENKSITSVLKYDETTNSSTYCVTGDEDTCIENTCVEDKTTCVPGTIINYNVNDTTNLRFNVLHDDGDTITMQQSTKTLTSPWYDAESPCKTTNGPLTALTALENATENWTNVNKFDYSIGDSSSSLGYSACSSYNTCNTTRYSLSKSNVNVRMVTVQELYAAAGNVNIEATVAHGGGMPKWMGREAFSTMSAQEKYDNSELWFVVTDSGGCINNRNSCIDWPVRAVVEINK